MSAEQTEEPVAEPQPEEPKGLLQPSRVGIYASLRSDYARQDKTTRHTSPMLKWNLTHIEVGISFLKRNLTHIEVKLHPPWECLVETVLSYPPLLVKPGC